jgi:hypothetical protein
MARDGISINNIIHRKPTKICRSDASEFGIGGYNIKSESVRATLDHVAQTYKQAE